MQSKFGTLKLKRFIEMVENIFGTDGIRGKQIAIQLMPKQY